jgi:hypothetical protein
LVTVRILDWNIHHRVDLNGIVSSWTAIPFVLHVECIVTSSGVITFQEKDWSMEILRVVLVIDHSSVLVQDQLYHRHPVIFETSFRDHTLIITFSSEINISVILWKTDAISRNCLI